MEARSLAAEVDETEGEGETKTGAAGVGKAGGKAGG